MIETAVFSIFHRAPARPEAVPSEPVPPAPLPDPVPESPVAQEFPEVSAQVDPPVEEPPAEPIVDLVAEVPPPSADAPSFDGESAMCDIAAEHELIGLANPEVFSVAASFDGSAPIPLSADPSGLYRPKSFRAAPWSGFAYDQSTDGLTGLGAGTRLLTARGEVAVEGLLPGDSVLALRGPALLPITWVGRSAAKEPPVLIEPGALGPNRPRRPLCLAADHPVFIDPMPVPARQLVNGTTIRTTADTETELFHIDVGAAEVLLAEGIPLSSGSRLNGAGTSPPAHP